MTGGKSGDNARATRGTTRRGGHAPAAATGPSQAHAPRKAARRDGHDAPDAAARARRRLVRAAIRRDAARRVAEVRATPTGRALYRPVAVVGAIIILAVAGAGLVGRLGHAIRDDGAIPRLRHAINSLDALATALGRYRFHTGAYPTTEQGLAALMENPGADGWLGPYLVQLLPDPWGNPYRYELADDGSVRLATCGPDMRPGTADDLHPEPAAFDPGVAWTNGWLPVGERLPDVDAYLKLLDER